MCYGLFEWEDEANDGWMHNNLGVGRKKDKEMKKAEDEQIVELKKQIQNYEEELGRLKYICYGLIILLIRMVFGRLF